LVGVAELFQVEQVVVIGHIQLVALAPADLPQVGFEEGDDQAKGDVAAQVGDGGFQVLGGDRRSEQGFVGVFELDDRVFYHQGQGGDVEGFPGGEISVPSAPTQR